MLEGEEVLFGTAPGEAMPRAVIGQGACFPGHPVALFEY